MTTLPTQVNPDLYNSVYNANEAIKQIYDLKNQEDALRSEAAQLRITAQRKRTSYRKKHIWMPFVFLLPATTAILLIFALLGEIIYAIGLTSVGDTLGDFLGNALFGSGLNFLVFIFGEGLLICALTFIFPCKDKKLLEAAEVKEHQADLIEQHINEIIATYSKELLTIAQKYRYPKASEYLVELFELGRASSLPEAYDKLEEQLHRWRMEESMSAMIGLQSAQLEFLKNIDTNTFWS